MHNENIDHKILAKHFNNTIQGMWRLKDKYKKTKTGLWSIYIKAYNWDLFGRGLGDKNPEQCTKGNEK